MTGAAVCVKSERQKLCDIADKIKADLQAKQGRCLRSMEWGGIPLPHRMAVMLMAGIDGDLGALARKGWAEFTPMEQETVAVALRSIYASLKACNALRVKA